MATLRAGDRLRGSFQVANGRRIRFAIIGPDGYAEIMANGLGEITIDGGPLPFEIVARRPGQYLLRFDNPGYFMSSAISGTYSYFAE